MSEKFSVMRNLADHLGSADSLGENQDSPSLELFNNRVKQLKNQRINHQKIDNKEHQDADLELEKFLSITGSSANQNELFETKQNNLELNNNLSVAEQIKTYKEELSQQGKSQTEILSLLISKFQGNESVSKWVENWQNFLRLHQLAETKPPAERKAIEKIMSTADFTDESAFQTTLSQISQSDELSAETKFEISREFGGSDIDSVDGMDYQLKQVKKHTQAIEREINTKSTQKESLDSEIEDLENELDALSLDDPKRKELQEQLEQKKEQLEKTENEIDRLEKGKPKDTSFQLREGIKAKLNPDGSRSIMIDDDFSLKLLSNKWLFSDKRNMRAINLGFPYKILKELHLADIIFSPNIENGAVPIKSQRDMGHLILGTLGIDDARILSEEDIKSLRKSLTELKSNGGKTGKEHFTELGVFDVDSQSLNQFRFLNYLKSINKG